MKVFFNILKIHFESPPQYDFSRKSFIPNLSKFCFLPSYAEYVERFPNKKEDLTEEAWRDHNSDLIKFACLERIFIGIGIVAIVFGLILSIWIKLDSEFQNLYKPAVNKNELSTVRSTLLRTDEAGSFNTSHCQEESVTVKKLIARYELE